MGRSVFLFEIIDALVPTIIAFGFPLAAYIIGYVKMSETERKEVRETFLTLKSLFTGGFIGLGLFVVAIGDALTINSLKVVGLLFLIPGTVFTSVIVWKRSKVKGMTTVLFLSVVIYFWGLPV
ncbi:hypothetical protein R0K17_19010, partial [Planococcus sp. SIMBA_143]